MTYHLNLFQSLLQLLVKHTEILSKKICLRMTAFQFQKVRDPVVSHYSGRVAANVYLQLYIVARMHACMCMRNNFYT